MTGRKLKVLVLADSRSFHTERYVAELRKQNCEVVLASLESGIIDYHALHRRGPIRAFHYSLAAAEVGSLIQRFQPDIVNPHFASGYGYLAALATRRRSLPVLLHLWGSDILIVPQKSFLHRRKTRSALEAADHVIGDSDYLLSEADKIAPLQNKRTIVWGLERQHLKLHQDNKPLSRPLEIIVPRPHEVIYNNLFVVRALPDLINREQIKLTFPDFGSGFAEFKTKTAQLVGDRLRYYPKLPREEYLRLAAEHDVYLSASRSDSSPASLLEAMALGLVPVTGDIPGVREWLTPDSGYLFDLADERSLCKAVSQLIDTDYDHTLMRRTNLERILQKGIFEDNIAEMISIMSGLAGESK